jgi:isoleucyl-tRNA synthetase
MNSSVTHAEDLRFSEKGVEETLRSVLLPLWNTFYFFTTYANADGWEVTQNAELKTQNPLDKWILSELNILVREMTENLEKYEIQKAVSPLAKFLDGLTNWYIRRSRRRFWKSENDGDKNEAYTTLFEVLKTVAKLLAPITPFLAEKIWRDLGDGESVHLENWPEVDDSKIDKELSAATYNTRKIVSLGLEIRARNKIKNRQPLQKAIIGTPKETFDLWVRDQIEIIQEELNVKEIIQEEPSKLGEIKLKVNFPVAGTRLGPKVKEVAKALGNRKYDKKSDENHISVHLEDEDISLDMEEVIIGFSAKNPQNTSESEGLVVTLNLEISEDLKLEGQARDLVRVIQDLRKKADYDVSDRIELQLEGAEEILKVHEKYITAETLAEKVTSKLDTPDAEDSLGEIKIGVKKV